MPANQRRAHSAPVEPLTLRLTTHHLGLHPSSAPEALADAVTSKLREAAAAAGLGPCVIGRLVGQHGRYEVALHDERSWTTGVVTKVWFATGDPSVKVGVAAYSRRSRLVQGSALALCCLVGATIGGQAGAGMEDPTILVLVGLLAGAIGAWPVMTSLSRSSWLAGPSDELLREWTAVVRRWGVDHGAAVERG